MKTRIRESLWIFVMLSTTLGILDTWWISVVGGAVFVYLLVTIRGEEQ